MADGGMPKRLVREIGAIARGTGPAHSHLRQRIAGIALVTLVVDAIGTLLVLAFEDGAPGSEVTNLGDSLFWTTCQLLTVSSQLRTPLTTGGRIVDVGLELYAITVVASLAGSFGAFFHRRSIERAPIEHRKDAPTGARGA